MTTDQNPLLDFDDIAVDLDACTQPFDVATLFRRPGPIHLEIGAGKGTFLLNQARAHPHRNFLGIEWANKFYRYSIDRMKRWQIDNVRILRTDARDFIRSYLLDNSIDTFHVYFPDPWPKKRHHKRRFFANANLVHITRCLVPQGRIRVTTDHAGYFDVIRELLIGTPHAARLLEPTDFYPTDAAQPGEWVGSNFERKYLKEGRRIFTLAVKKRRTTVNKPQRPR